MNELYVPNVTMRDALRVKDEEIEELQKENNRLRSYLESINTYDMQVKAVVEQDEQLQKAWKQFRVRYSLVVSDELVETARTKVKGIIDKERQKYAPSARDGNVCPTCHLSKNKNYRKFTFFP